MNTALKILKTEDTDRPGWIPADILHGWDTNPYAYQTEEELMPAGGLHGQILAYIMEILRNFLEKQGLMLLMDTFMLYRDKRGIKRRIAPDFLLMPFRFPPPSAYDLDTEPPPICIMEVTSPKSHLKDLKNNVRFYSGLGVTAYFAIDAITPQAKLRKEIQLYLWRTINNWAQQTQPGSSGSFTLPEMNVTVSADGQRLIFTDMTNGEVLHDTGQLRQIAEKERRKAKKEQHKARQERERAEKEQQRAEKEQQRADAAEKLAERLAAKLRAMGITDFE